MQLNTALIKQALIEQVYAKLKMVVSRQNASKVLDITIHGGTHAKKVSGHKYET